MRSAQLRMDLVIRRIDYIALICSATLIGSTKGIHINPWGTYDSKNGFSALRNRWHSSWRRPELLDSDSQSVGLTPQCPSMYVHVHVHTPAEKLSCLWKDKAISMMAMPHQCLIQSPSSTWVLVIYQRAYQQTARVISQLFFGIP